MSGDTEKTELSLEASKRIDPILEHLNVDGLDLNKIRTHFCQLWEFEKGDELSPEEQHLTMLGVFMYAAHAALDDININVVKARGHITQAFTDWLKPETDKMVEEEQASDNPFKTFVDKSSPQAEEFFSWRYFLMETKKADDKEWNFKMKQCWFHQFFIRLGRPDWIETACHFDQIPAKAREEYVNLKLSNTFSKLGSFCQFKYTPKT